MEAWRSRSAYDSCALPVEEDQADMMLTCDVSERMAISPACCYSLRPLVTGFVCSHSAKQENIAMKPP